MSLGRAWLAPLAALCLFLYVNLCVSLVCTTGGVIFALRQQGGGGGGWARARSAKGEKRKNNACKRSSRQPEFCLANLYHVTHGAKVCKDENRNGCVGLYVFVNTTTVAESDILRELFFGKFCAPLGDFCS